MLLSFAFGLCLVQDPTPMDWSALGRSMQATIERLAELGIEVDSSRVRVRSADEGELRRAIELENIAALGESWFELQRVLDLAVGRSVPAEASQYCSEQHARMPVQAGLNYIAGMDQLLVHPTLVLSSEGYAQAMVRELYRAYDDQRQDVRDREKRVGTTAEAVLVARAWSHAHAEWAVSRALNIAVDERATPLEERTASSALHARCGMQWLRTDAQAAIPQTSEQLLHCVEKGREPGTPIAPIPLEIEGLALLRDEQLGEIGLRMLLAQWGVEPVQALAAGIGWDGDRWALWIGKDGLRVLQARIVFDRELDARQWEAALKPLWKGALRCRGTAVDLVWSNKAELQRAAESALNNWAWDGQTEESKARSTEQLEARLLREQPTLENGTWRVPEQAFALSVGPGWSQAFEGGRVMLVRGEERLMVGTLPTPGPMSGAELLAAVEDTLKQAGTGVSGKAEALRVGNRDGVRLRYSRDEGGKKWFFAEVQVPGQRSKLVLTLRHSEAVCDGCEAMLASLRIEAAR